MTTAAVAPARREYLAAGEMIAGRYEIVREIGRGGFSAVYAARDRMLDTDVAVKLLVPPPAVAEQARERLRREVQLVRGLAHEHIVGVHDFVDDGVRTYLVMELVDGLSLGAHVRAEGPLPAARVAELGREMADALGAVHARGVLHRDVKPDNILLDARGTSRLTDFGSARIDGRASLTQTGAVVGTLGFLAPEVLAGRRADARADIYGLGVTLYFALTGALPDRGFTPAPADAGYRPSARQAAVPAWLDAVVAQATAANPAQRFATAQQFAAALAGPDAARAEIAGALIRLTCLACGEPVETGRNVCDACASAPGTDTLVVVRGEERPRARVSATVAARVVDALQRDGAAARSVPATLAWTALPARTWVLIVAVIGIGTVAASRVASPALQWTGWLLAVLLLGAADAAMRRPAVRVRRGEVLPPALGRCRAETLAALPSGSARNLFAALARDAEVLFALLARHGDPRDLGAQVAELFTAAAEVSLDLAALDLLLDADARSAADAVREARLASARERLAQRLLEATATVRELGVHVVAIDDASADRVAELTTELARERDAQRLAVDEVRALLA